MIFGIGTDIVSVKRIEDSLSKFGERFVHRVLNEEEVVEYGKSTYPARFLAKRFAVKEAFSKAFGTGIGTDVGWHDVAVDHDERGKPLLKTSLPLGSKLAVHNISAMHVSISDEPEHAIAFVILEKT